jgi:DNA-binding NarL/FixJ family response regulator
MNRPRYDEEGPTVRTITVYLVDDNRDVRTALVELVEAVPEFRVVGSSGTMAKAVPEIARLRPTIAVVDEWLPDGTGPQVCRRIRSRVPDVAVVILSAGVSGENGRSEAEAAGASAYVLKQVVDFSLLNVLIRLVSTGPTQPEAVS